MTNMSTPSRQRILSYITDADNFDVWECVGKCEIDGDIDGIVKELEEYQHQNANALVDLINMRYNDLVALSKILSEIKDVTNEIKYPLMILQKQVNEKVKIIKQQIAAVVEELTKKQQEDERKEKEAIETQIRNCEERLHKNITNPKTVESVEVACYQLEILKYLLHTHSQMDCVQEITSLSAYLQ